MDDVRVLFNKPIKLMNKVGKELFASVFQAAFFLSLSGFVIGLIVGIFALLLD